MCSIEKLIHFLCIEGNIIDTNWEKWIIYM